MKKNLSVYIHIPFCIRKCEYCDFLSFPVGSFQKTGGINTHCTERDGVPEKYMMSLTEEIRRECEKYKQRKVDTVFIGGGTPSLMSERQTAELMGLLRQCFDISQDAEISMEANPGTLTKEKLNRYHETGINRLSIGLQSADAQELKLLGRIHNYDDFVRTYELARRLGFENINVDLMSGLPGQDITTWRRTLGIVSELAPEHVSAYGLMVEEGTPFYERYGEPSFAGYRKLPEEEAERQMYHETAEILERYGLVQYEISNYARPGYECRHNIGYWTGKDYAGFGLGAASMVEHVRWKNTSDIHEYMKCADEVSAAVRETGTGGERRGCKTDVSVLTVQEQMEETMFLGLRMNCGVSAADFKKMYGVAMKKVYGDWIRKMTESGLLLDEEHVRLTKKGRDLANYVMAGFLL